MITTTNVTETSTQIQVLANPPFPSSPSSEKKISNVALLGFQPSKQVTLLHSKDVQELEIKRKELWKAVAQNQRNNKEVYQKYLNLNENHLKLEEKLKELNKTKEVLEANQNNLQENIKKQEQVLLGLVEDKNNLSDHLAKLQEENLNLTSRLEKCESHRKDLSKRYEENLEKLTILKTKYEEISSDETVLSENYTQLQNKHEELVKNNNQLNANYQELNTRYTKVEKNNSSSMEQLKSLNENNKQMKLEMLIIKIKHFLDEMPILYHCGTHFQRVIKSKSDALFPEPSYPHPFDIYLFRSAIQPNKQTVLHKELAAYCTENYPEMSDEDAHLYARYTYKQILINYHKNKSFDRLTQEEKEFFFKQALNKITPGTP